MRSVEQLSLRNILLEDWKMELVNPRKSNSTAEVAVQNSMGENLNNPASQRQYKQYTPINSKPHRLRNSIIISL